MIVAIVPVKTVTQGKSRLASILSEEQRVTLIGQLLRRTLGVLLGCQQIHQTIVVTPDPRVMAWSKTAGATTLAEKPMLASEDHLNGALNQAAQLAQSSGAMGLLILPADLPFVTPDELACFLDKGQSRQMVICPDRHEKGTNALLLTPPVPFTFQYGEQSYQKHLLEAKRRELTWCSFPLPGLTFDLDTVADWRDYQRQVAELVAS
jgi:2-phospho-L-lactate guanylyltransferase